MRRMLLRLCEEYVTDGSITLCVPDFINRRANAGELTAGKACPAISLIASGEYRMAMIGRRLSQEEAKRLLAKFQ